jgi:hypothetical protein
MMANKQQGCGCSCGGGSCETSETGERISAAKLPAGMETNSRLRFTDILGALRVRLGIRRNYYRVTPGLYRIGSPDRSSSVFVSANYKLSFDKLRQSLAKMNAWILVLDTRGINVWCAAGKGTFGTTELINKIRATALDQKVSHKKLILPQLGAPGVAAHEVKKQTGFSVVYGPVRAKDIAAFINNGMKARGEMRRVRFHFSDRLVLVPLETVGALKYALLLGALAFGITLLLFGVSSIDSFLKAAVNATGVFTALAAGSVLTPLLLPWLPGRSFSLKGLIMGAITGLVFVLLSGKGIGEAAAWILFISASSSFLAMGFTGASTYTNLSGTVKEMSVYVPIQIVSAALGIILFIILGIVTATGG